MVKLTAMTAFATLIHLFRNIKKSIALALLSTSRLMPVLVYHIAD